MAVFTNTQARMNSLIITLYLNLWTKDYISDKDEAYKRAMMISGIAQVGGIISSVLFGFIFEKAKNSILLIINNLLIIIGYGMLFFLKPTDNLVILSFVISAFGFYGLTTIGYVILNKNVGCSARGAVMGVNTWAGAIGLLILSTIGHTLFDNVTNLAPFMISMLFSFIVLIVLLFPGIREKINNNMISDLSEI